jgi:hypothetical protein
MILTPQTAFGIVWDSEEGAGMPLGVWVKGFSLGKRELSLQLMHGAVLLRAFCG